MHSKKTVLVTGASGGIGGAIATAFALAGHHVALGCHTNVAAAQQLAGSLAGCAGRLLVCQGNVSCEDEVNAMFTHIEQNLGPVQLLVTAHGHAQQQTLGQLSLAQWQNMLNVHVTGTFLCCRRALGGMLAQKDGAIVTVSSMWGQVGAACEVHYSAAKGAVIAFSKALAKELAPSGIRVNCVAPGAIATGMMQGFTQDEIAGLCEEIPMGRLGSPGEVAQAVLFLCSPGAAYFTGQVLAPNGGFVV